MRNEKSTNSNVLILIPCFATRAPTLKLQRKRKSERRRGVSLFSIQKRWIKEPESGMGMVGRGERVYNSVFRLYNL